jgi:predicted membrane-bound spermidine synthase
MKKLAIFGSAGLIFGFVLGVVLLKITPIPGVHTDVGAIATALVGLIGGVKSKKYYTLFSGSSIGCCGTIMYALGISTVVGYIIFGSLCVTLVITMIRMMIQEAPDDSPRA